MKTQQQIRKCIVPIFLICAVGCGKGNTSVQGTVTFNGQTVEKGYITFFPVGDARATFGGEIVDGKYHVQDVPNGKRRVHIRAYPNMRVVKGKGRQTFLDVTPAASDIAINDIGNNQVVELSGGDQTLDIQLRKRSS